MEGGASPTLRTDRHRGFTVRERQAFASRWDFLRMRSLLAAVDAAARVEHAFRDPGLRAVCLFPAMHHVPVDDPRTDAVVAIASRHKRVVFVHGGVLSVGVVPRPTVPKTCSTS